MTNGEKYKTAKERADAFDNMCHGSNNCNGCKLACKGSFDSLRYFEWLELEAEVEKPLPCPCCGADAEIYYEDDVEREGDASVQCKGCFLATPDYPSDVEAVVAWNRRMSNQKEIEVKLYA